ncbi:MAG: hypothetical protein Q9213_004698 [Squamulea squamosa]
MATPSPSVLREWRNYLHNDIPGGSRTSVDTVQKSYSQHLTPNSLRSLGSVSSSPLRVRSENVQPTRLFRQDGSTNSASLFPSPQRTSNHSSRKSSWGNEVLVPPQTQNISAPAQKSSLLEVVNFESLRVTDHDSANGSDKENLRSRLKEPRLSFDESDEEVLSLNEPARSVVTTKAEVLQTDIAGPRTSSSFKRWISHLRPPPLKRKKTLTVRQQRWSLDDSPSHQDDMNVQKSDHVRTRDKKTSTQPPTRLCDAVRAVMTERPGSSPTPRQIRRSNPFSRSNRSSRRSEDQARSSAELKALEVAAHERTTQRQKTLEELVVSEAGYIADLKVLIHVRTSLDGLSIGTPTYNLKAYFTLLDLAPNVSQLVSKQIQHNVTEILALHQDLLAQIQHFVIEPMRRELPVQAKHNRRRSINGHHLTSAITGLVHTARTSYDRARPMSLKGDSAPADTNNVTEIAKVFGKMLGRFFVYEEYGANYELMLREMSTTSKSIANWHAFERSIEALANSLASSSASEESTRKGLTFEDLLIKPIQRICKYPLMFDDLYSNTLEVDNAESRAELGKVVWRLRETAEEINRATNDQNARARVQRSWQLQDLLILPEVSTSPASLRLLGHAVLCGVLYVAYESGKEVRGAYTLCVLFKSHLLLAVPQAVTQPDILRYDIVALISLYGSLVEKADNGRGLQCHTAAFSWKLIFEHSQQLYEFIFCACSRDEEEAWTRATAQHAEDTSHKQQDEISLLQPMYTFLILNASSLGPVFGMPGTLTRRLSVQRAATVHARTNGAQVIIRNTAAAKDSKDGLSDSLGRSKSTMTASRVPILAPKRAERSRMESSLAEVWSRDQLPFPGMKDNNIRASASSMIRKISRASFSSTFSKMSSSTTSFADAKSVASSTDLHKIGEGSDERDPRQEAYQSLRSTPGDFWSVGGGQSSIGRSGTVKGVKLADATNQIRDRVASRVSAQRVRIESTEKGSPRIVRNRRSVPSGLLKGFSPAAILERRA